MTTKSEIRIFEKNIKPQKFEKNTHAAFFFRYNLIQYFEKERDNRSFSNHTKVSRY